MTRHVAWLTIMAFIVLSATASGQLAPSNVLPSIGNTLSGIEGTPCPSAFANTVTAPSLGSRTFSGGSFNPTGVTIPGLAPNSPLGTGNPTSNPGTALSPGITNASQQGTTFTSSNTGLTTNTGLPTLSQPISGTGFSSGTPLQYSPATGFTQATTTVGANSINLGAGITPGVGLTASGIPQVSGVNPGASISPAVTGGTAGTNFGVTC